MNELREQQLLAGQSSIAQKVYGFVPIQDSWSTYEIRGAAMAAAATTAPDHAIRRALAELKDAGLIREPTGGKFRRDATTLKPKIEKAMTQLAKQTVVSIKKPEGALDVLAALSGEVVILSDEFSKRMKALAGRIEEVALSVEAERESNAETITKAKRLHEALKEFA